MQQEHINDVSKHIRLERKCGFYELYIKRLMDIVCSLAAIIVFSSLYIIVAVLVRVKLGSPVLFKQPRPGKIDPKTGREKIFFMYKFRSMIVQDEKSEKSKWTTKDDPRVTKVGKFIRKTSIDELPQFWNILKGDMSLVGTRPPTKEEYEQYSQHHKIRLSFRPGLTGMWQVSGRSDITDFEEVVRLDEKYIEEWSIWLDIKIIFKTVGVVLMRKGSE